MANTLITPTIIAREMMLQVENNLVWAKLVNRDYENEFKKIGDTVQIRRPVKYSVRTGQTMSVQDTEEGNISLQLSNYKGVDFGFASKDLTLTIDDFSERYIKPAAIALANQVDQDVSALALRVANHVGTLGSTISSYAALARGPQRMDEHAVPYDSRCMVLNPGDFWGMAGHLSGLYVDPTAKQALVNGKLPTLGNLDLYMSQNVNSFTTGARGGTPQVNGANQNVTYAASKASWTQTLLTKGWSNNITGVVKAGDIFTFTNVYDVNPASKVATRNLKQFTVVSDANSDGSGLASLTITPPIITSGPQITASVAPTDSTNITFLGSASTVYQPSVAFHKNAFALAVRPLDIPPGAHPQSKRVDGEGLSLRMIPVYDGVNDVSNFRFDILYGVKAVYPELAVRVSG